MTDPTLSANLRHSPHAPREPLVGHPMAVGAPSEPVGMPFVHVPDQFTLFRPQPDDATIEAAAKRAYERSRKCPTLRDLGPWDELKGLYRSDWLGIVEAALR